MAVTGYGTGSLLFGGEEAEWEQSRDQAISDEEIDLDAGDDPDEWSVYLTRVPRKK